MAEGNIIMGSVPQWLTDHGSIKLRKIGIGYRSDNDKLLALFRVQILAVPRITGYSVIMKGTHPICSERY